MLKKRAGRALILSILAVLFAGSLISCTDMFTTSWGGWAKRDRDTMEINVTADNIDSLMNKSANDPELQQAILRNLLKSQANASGSEKAKLQNAGTSLAINSSGLLMAVLKEVTSLDDLDTMDHTGLADLFGRVLDNTLYLDGSSKDLLALVPDPVSDPAGFKSYTDNVGGSDLAMAAVLLLCSDAKASGDAQSYIDSFDGTATPDHPMTDLALELAKASVAKDPDGIFASVLAHLNLDK